VDNDIPYLLLVINNGAYGQRIATIPERLGNDHLQLQTGEAHAPTVTNLDQLLECSAEVLTQMQIDPVPYEEGAAT
jgi:aspartate aminotransferase-like enzyme